MNNDPYGDWVHLGCCRAGAYQQTREQWVILCIGFFASMEIWVWGARNLASKVNSYLKLCCTVGLQRDSRMLCIHHHTSNMAVTITMNCQNHHTDATMYLLQWSGHNHGDGLHSLSCTSCKWLLVMITLTVILSWHLWLSDHCKSSFFNANWTASCFNHHHHMAWSSLVPGPLVLSVLTGPLFPTVLSLLPIFEFWSLGLVHQTRRHASQSYSLWIAWD